MAVDGDRQSIAALNTPPGHPGWGGTIESFNRARVMAEYGRPSILIDFFTDCYERDPTLFSLVNARRAAVTGKPVIVIPASDAAEDIAAAELFRAEVWDGLDVAALVEFHQHSTNFTGWAASEIQWAWTGTRYDPVDLYHIASRTFLIATEFNPRVPGAQPDELLCRVGPYEHQVERLRPDKWIVTKRVRSQRFAQCSLMQAAVPYSLFKSNGVAAYFNYVARYGVPFLNIEIADWTNDHARALAYQIGQRVGTDSYVVTGQNDEIRIKVEDGISASRSATSDVHARQIEFFNHEMTKIFNGGILTSETGEKGSYAQSREQGGLRADFIREDVARLSASLRDGLIKPWMRINGIPGQAPKIWIQYTRSEDPRLITDLAKMLFDMGIPVDANHLYQSTGLQPPKAGIPTGGNDEESNDD